MLQPDRGFDQGHRPTRNGLELARLRRIGTEHLPVHQLQQQDRCGDRLPGRSLGAVVEDLQMGQVRQKSDEVAARTIPALANLRFRDVMATARHSGRDALEVQFHRGQAAKPHHDIVRVARLREQARNGAGAECRFKGEVPAVRDRVFQLLATELPRCSVGFVERHVQPRHQLPRVAVRVEPGQVVFGEQVPTDGTLARAIHPRKHEDERTAPPIHQKLLPALGAFLALPFDRSTLVSRSWACGRCRVSSRALN